MPAILEVRDLRKSYKNVEAVKGISFTIEQGTCFGLLGPNGAGKTTTIEMIEGITPPTSGEIRYRGVANNPEFKTQSGIQFQATALMDFLTVREVIALFSGFYQETLSLEKLTQLCALSEFLERPAAKLSGGQRQRVLLALALLNDPHIVFLDEPTTGLDPQSRRNFWQLIESIKAQGKTIVLTTHYMDEAEYLCDQLLIVDSGKIITQGTPKGLLREHFGFTYIDLPEGAMAADLLANFEHSVTATGVEIISHNVDQTLQTLIELQVDLTSLQIRNPTLDDLFLKITGQNLRD